MRALAFSLCLVLAGAWATAGAAHAQVVCEGSATGRAGEVIAAYDLDRDGRVKALAVSWLPERKEGVGVESGNFSRPSLILDYRMTEAGVLSGPVDANVLITKFHDDDGNPPPPSGAVTVRISAPGAEPVEWTSSTTKGEKALAKLVADAAPSALTIELRTRGGATLASSEYDLSQTGEMQKLAQAAKADGDARVAAFVKLAAEGKAGETCPML